MNKDWIAGLDNVNEIRISGTLGEIANRSGGRVLAASLECDDFSVTLLVRNAPAEVRRTVFREGNQVEIRGRLGRSLVDWFIDVSHAEALPIHDQAKRLAARGVKNVPQLN